MADAGGHREFDRLTLFTTVPDALLLIGSIRASLHQKSLTITQRDTELAH